MVRGRYSSSSSSRSSSSSSSSSSATVAGLYCTVLCGAVPRRPYNDGYTRIVALSAIVAPANCCIVGTWSGPVEPDSRAGLSIPDAA